MNESPPFLKYVAVVPAAGIGRRMGGDLPKQYLKLSGQCVIEHTLNTLLAVPEFETIIVVVSPDDEQWQNLALAKHPKITTVTGGSERCHSVLNGLHHASTFADDDTWILVHDVARPCVAADDIHSMIRALADHPVGGILAVPVSDTIKRVDGTVITETVDRSVLWQAQTPQMFRLGLLRSALENALHIHAAITDEASAVELAGKQPVVYAGSSFNLKITRPEDLALAECILAAQASAS